MGRFLLILLSSSIALWAGNITINNNGATVGIQENTGSSSVRRATGQTFIVPTPTSESQLTEFTLEFGGAPSGFDCRVYIYEWDGVDRPTGAALFDSGAIQVNAAGNLNFSGLMINLTPGTPYLVMITTQGVSNDANNGAILMTNNGNVYTDGSNWGLTSTSATETHLSEAWAEVAANAFDMDFLATFGMVPVELQSFSVE